MSKNNEKAQIIGNNIRQKREELGWTQTKLAKLIGSSQSLLSEYERGKVLPQFQTLDAIAKALRVRIDWLTSEHRATQTPAHSMSSNDRPGVRPVYTQFAKTIGGHLERLVAPMDEVVRASLRDHSIAIIEDMLLFDVLNGERGIPRESIEAFMDAGATPDLPQYIYERRNTTRKPARNGDLAFVTRWDPPLIDAGGILELRLVPSDWHMKQSIDHCRGRILADLAEGRIEDVAKVPGHLCISMVIETQHDRQLLLCLRGHHVADHPSEWSVGIGEHFRPSDDFAIARDGSGKAVHPALAVTRGLSEETGISDALLNEALVTFLGCGLSVQTFGFVLFCHVQLYTDMPSLIQSCQTIARDREHVPGQFRSIGFDREHPVNLENCIDLIVSGKIAPRDRSGAARAVTSWSRVALLLSCLHRYGTKNVLAELEKR